MASYCDTYDIIVNGNFNFNKKYKKINVKIIMRDSDSESDSSTWIVEDNKKDIIDDYYDYDYLSDLL